VALVRTQVSAEKVEGVPNGVGEASMYWLVPLKLRANLASTLPASTGREKRSS